MFTFNEIEKATISSSKLKYIVTGDTLTIEIPQKLLNDAGLKANGRVALHRSNEDKNVLALVKSSSFLEGFKLCKTRYGAIFSMKVTKRDFKPQKRVAVKSKVQGKAIIIYSHKPLITKKALVL